MFKRVVHAVLWRPLLALVVAAPLAVTAAPAGVSAADDDVLAVVFDGQGNGHGRGLSQYGALGWATTYGRDWRSILDFYYGGTSAGAAPSNARITVTLAPFDGTQTAVVAAGSNASWSGSNTGAYASLVARETSSGASSATFKVWGNTARLCPSATDSLSSWTYLGQVSAAFAAPGPRFTVPGGDDPRTAPSALLGVCEPSGAVRHYRGSVYATNRTDGANRTINDVLVEGYLRGVLPREMPAAWADRGSGSGINALRAQSVAARSYALAQGGGLSAKRFAHAKTCDTDMCQVYGGAATRPAATGAVSVLEDVRTDRAVADTARVIRVRSSSPGVPVSTEFSSSNGDRTAGVSFPAVDDPADMSGVNPWSRWSRLVPAADLAARFGLSKIVSVDTVPDSTAPGGTYGVTPAWAVAVRLSDGVKTVTVPASQLRSAYGFPSAAVVARAVRAGAASADDVAFVGDSVGASVTGPSGPLPLLLDGPFASAAFDAEAYRCTVGSCPPATRDGLTAARNLAGSPEVVLVELGYNDSASGFAGKIDQVVGTLVARGVSTVAWVTLSERRMGTTEPLYAPHNRALRAAAARWPQLVVLDWNAASISAGASWWFTDGVHLSPTGRVRFSLWIHEQSLTLASRN